MFVIPSIDLMAGEVVRLAQGKATEKKVYSKEKKKKKKKNKGNGERSSGHAR